MSKKLTSKPSPQQKKFYIEIVGALGVGKTSLAEVFQEKCGFVASIEREDALLKLPFVSPYLSEPEKYGLQGALNFFAFHFNNLSETIYNNSTEASIVSDWSALIQYAYGKAILEKDELEAIKNLIAPVQKKLPQRNLIICISPPLEEHLRRIQKRGRELDDVIPISFIKGIRDNLEEALLLFADNTPILYLDSADLDWVNSEQDKEHILCLVENCLKERLPRKPKAFRPN